MHRPEPHHALHVMKVRRCFHAVGGWCSCRPRPEPDFGRILWSNVNAPSRRYVSRRCPMDGAWDTNPAGFRSTSGLFRHRVGLRVRKISDRVILPDYTVVTCHRNGQDRAHMNHGNNSRRCAPSMQDAKRPVRDDGPFMHWLQVPGSAGRIRTYNPPVNSRMLHH